jgi:hypothetical protein
VDPRLRLCLHCLKNHRGRVENDFIRALKYGALGHFDSQIKESSDSPRRRHSNEGVNAEFLVQLYQKTLLSDSLDKNKYLVKSEIFDWIFGVYE